MKILITDISSPKAIAIAKYIKRSYSGVTVISCDTRGISGYIHTRYTDKHYVLPAKIRNGKEYLRSLLSVIDAEKIDLCFPVNNMEMKVLMRHRDELPRAFGYLGSRESFESLDNKAALHSLAAALSIPAPKTYKSVGEAACPFVIKPVDLSSSKGISYIFDAAQKRRYQKAAHGPELICQEYISGFGAGYSVFCAGGEILCGFGHKRLLEYPIAGGTSVYRENYANSGMRDTAKKILRKVNWSGFVMFEFKIDGTDKAFLIEANPRIWGSINQGLENGTNYFEFLLGKPDRPASPGSAGIKTYYSPLVYFSLLGYTLHLQLARVKLFLNNISSNKGDASLLDDPMGWFSFFNIAYEKN